MKGSLRLGRLAGIEIKVHLTFLLIFVWVALKHRQADAAGRGLVAELLFTLALFACVLLHELGHALMAKRFGVRTRDIILLPIGGVARLERIPEKPVQELLVAIAGPAVNVVIAAALFVVLGAARVPLLVDPAQLVSGSVLAQLAWMNVMLVVFNSIPAFPMDGGRVLRAVLALRLDYRLATRIAAAIGQAVALLFGLAGVFSAPPNPFLVLIALFVWIGAAQEANLVEMKRSLEGVSVGQVMMTDFVALRPEDELQRAVDLTLAGHQRDFPVLDGDRPVGLLSQSALLRALTNQGSGVRVRDVMDGNFMAVEADQPIEPLLQQLRERNAPGVAVLRQGRVAGLLTLDNLGEFFAIRSALARKG